MKFERARRGNPRKPDSAASRKRHRILNDALIFPVLSYADHFDQWALWPFNAEALSQHVLTRPELFRHGLIDDRHRRRFSLSASANVRPDKMGIRKVSK